MEYLEKAKYELILGIKNKEDNNIIDVLKKYYDDVNNIISKNDSLYNKKHKFVVACKKINDDNNDIKLFLFSEEHHMHSFMSKYKDSYKFTYNYIKDIDPMDDTEYILINF